MSTKEKPRRNDPCRCGSLKKYKKCCLDRPVQEPSQQQLSLYNRRFELKGKSAEQALKVSLPKHVTDQLQEDLLYANSVAEQILGSIIQSGCYKGPKASGVAFS